MYTCNRTGAQHWSYDAATHDLVVTAADKCPDVKDRSAADGARTRIRSCTGGAHRKWILASP
ncbi:RICIN domain-containing protein [Streptomyces kanasensis]|uniref:Ricin B lectin domain-containing protein n=1 Tax=Streptomyces changanensis TaxID=2964669 RepID=A0ABY5NFA0_9ACTN|nr:MULTISPECIES: RICIN domain-containing protein [Streptomyces]UUS34669.1 hypothetical protein NRO40_02285 [Streptomyces changanensis]